MINTQSLHTIVLTAILLFWPILLWPAQPIFQYDNQATHSLMQQLAADSPSAPTSPDSRTYTLTIRHKQAANIVSLLKSLYSDSLFSADPYTNTILARTDPTSIATIRKLVKQLDTADPQILVDILILEINAQYVMDYRSLFSGLSDGLRFEYSFSDNRLSRFPIHSQLAGWIDEGNARILAQPSMTLSSGESGIIRVGEKIPYITTVFREESTLQQVHFVNTGLHIQLKATQLTDTAVRIDLDTSMEAIKLWRQLGNAAYPLLSSRQAKTSIVVQSGKLSIIGGLIDEQEKVTKAGVPVLKDLPLVGGLFESKNIEKTQNDIVFLVQPKIIKKTALE